MAGTSVYVADDHPVFREAVARALGVRPGFAVIGQTADGREALEGLRRLRPDVAVIDQRLPSLAGTDILRGAGREGLATRIVILSSDESGALVLEAVQLGAAGYLSKASTLEEICDAVAAVARGETVIAPQVQGGLAAELKGLSHPAPVVSPREAEVLRLIASGRSSPEIGRELFISASTVKTHTKSLFEKLGVSDRAAAVAEAMRRGLLE